MNWPLVKAILILPGTVIVYVPAFIIWMTFGTKWEFFIFQLQSGRVLASGHFYGDWYLLLR